jgi:uncharacterized protein
MVPRPLSVDSHVHLSRWWPEIRRTGHRADLDYSVAGLLREMDQSGIDYALLIQLFQAPTEQDALEEGRALTGEGGGRLFPVATVDPTKGAQSVAEVLDRMNAEPRLVGVKLFPGYLPFYPSDPRLDPVYEWARRRDLPVLLHQGDTLDGQGLLKFARPLEVDELAARYRDVRFVLCHLGNPWIDEAAELVYKHPNVYADTSGLLPSPSSPYFDRAVRSCQRRIEEAIVSSGRPDRFLRGSDWPLQDLGLSARLIEELDLTAQDRDRVLGENARALFRLPLPAP